MIFITPVLLAFLFNSCTLAVVISSNTQLPSSITKATSSASVTSVNAPSGTAQPSTNKVKENVWADITDDEAAAIVKWLKQPARGLNLTAAKDATNWDNSILTIEALRPNKTDVLNYMDDGGPLPKRFARVTINNGATLKANIQEWMVGPLPLSSATTLRPLTYMYNSGRSKTPNLWADLGYTYEWIAEFGKSIQDITLTLLNTTFGDENGTLDVYGPDPAADENGKVINWVQFWSQGIGESNSGTLLPQGLYMKTDTTSRNSSNWKVIGWMYNNIVYNSTKAFRTAIRSPGFVKLPLNVDGDWTSTDRQGQPLPLDENMPPTAFQVSGNKRYKISGTEGRKQSGDGYVEWMGFTFYYTTKRDTGVTLWDIRFNGERILYELGIQEAVAHYAGQDPVQGNTAYLDSLYGLGASMFAMIPGYDCPHYATFLNSSLHRIETTTDHPNSICIFEHETGYPLQRHTSSSYTSVTKNTQLVFRTVTTVYNYDYNFDYIFSLDGSIEVKFRASGYIQGAYPAHNEDYGYRVHTVLSGSMHTHVLNYKADFDIGRTKNSFQKVDVVNENIAYPWSEGKTRNTMRLKRSFVKNEDESTLNWPANGQTMFVVVDQEAKNKYGELRGYRIIPGTGIGTPVHLAIADSPVLRNAGDYAKHDIFITRQKDTEPLSASPANALDTLNPLINFSDFLNGESLEQEDLVVWFNLGTHHIPHSGDIPNTVTATSQSSIIFAPYNFLDRDPSRQTKQQVRIDLVENKQDVVNKFGAVMAVGVLNVSDASPNLRNYQPIEEDELFEQSYYLDF